MLKGFWFVGAGSGWKMLGSALAAVRPRTAAAQQGVAEHRRQRTERFELPPPCGHRALRDYGEPRAG